MPPNALFDEWPKAYEHWFQTPIGRVIHNLERELLLTFISPQPGETILDAGCGTGIFTADWCQAGAHVTGLELARPMLARAKDKLAGTSFRSVQGNMLNLPFNDEVFNKSVSVTALEFIAEAHQAIAELFRVTRPGGAIIVATLNRLSPWAARRQAAGAKGHQLFKKAIFRSPGEVAALGPKPVKTQTAIHFPKSAQPSEARVMEANASKKKSDRGAFLVVQWVKSA